MDNEIGHRRHDRVRARLPVRIATIEPEKDPWTGRPFFRSLQETSANVSRGGAFVQTQESLDAGRRVLLELHLPNGSRVEAIGRVAWAKRVISPDGVAPEAGIGIEFLGGASEQFSALEDFLARADLALAEKPDE
jgi:Tfp pilus assembly protein PilZ